MSAPNFPKLDPSSPAFWDVRFAADFTPWERGEAIGSLSAWLQSDEAPTKAHVLVPGCGSGPELAAFARAGWRVTGVDFSAAGIAKAEQRRAALPAPLSDRITLVQADYFVAAPSASSIDVIFESAFLCALPPRDRQRWADAASRLRPGAILAGYFLLEDLPSQHGPPFAMPEATLEALLQPHFALVCSSYPTDSIAVFAGRERWMVWRRKASA
jgi:SAM-dependent methyltransferase